MGAPLSAAAVGCSPEALVDVGPLQKLWLSPPSRVGAVSCILAVSFCLSFLSLFCLAALLSFSLCLLLLHPYGGPLRTDRGPFTLMGAPSTSIGVP